MNELSHLIKSLAYSLTIVPVSSKSITALAKHYELRPELERLQKGLTRHRSEGYDLEGKRVPIEATFLTLLDRIQSNALKITELQKQCSLLIALEKNALLDLIGSVLAEMDERASSAQQILDAMAEKGIQLDDLSK